jgi:PilZ domain-containing protein
MSRLRSRYVSVQLPLHGELPAIVEAEDDAAVLLSLAVQAPAGIGRLDGRTVRIECISPRGIQRVTGAVSWSADQPEVLRVVKESDSVIQRREAVRVQAVVPAQLTVLALPALIGDEVPADLGQGQCAKTTSLNVSSTGILVRDPGSAPIGSRVRVELELFPGEPPVMITGSIVREDDHEKGVHTEEISREDANRLDRFINEKQRAELRMARG